MKKAILPDVVDVDTLFSEQAQKLKALIDEGYSFSVRLDSVEGRDRAVIVLKKDKQIHNISADNAVDIDDLDIDLEDEE